MVQMSAEAWASQRSCAERLNGNNYRLLAEPGN